MNRERLAGLVMLAACVSLSAAASYAGERDDTEVRAEKKQVGDAAVHYLVAGPADGQEVLLLHGARFTSAIWVQTGTIKLLAELGYRVIAVDLPGYGNSPKTKQQVDDWLSVAVRELCVGRPVLVVPSMSGRFALPLITAEPERVAGFVALAPAALKPFRSRLDGLTVPTLVIWGSKDFTIPAEQSTWLVEAMPNVQRVLIPGGKHTVYITHTEKFHEELARFLANLPSPTTQPAVAPTTTGPASSD